MGYKPTALPLSYRTEKVAWLAPYSAPFNLRPVPSGAALRAKHCFLRIPSKIVSAFYACKGIQWLESFFVQIVKFLNAVFILHIPNVLLDLFSREELMKAGELLSLQKDSIGDMPLYLYVDTVFENKVWIVESQDTCFINVREADGVPLKQKAMIEKIADESQLIRALTEITSKPSLLPAPRAFASTTHRFSW